jgi:squalene-hopene/tetraprenyl-beta-curcumene cyclase
MVAKALVQDPEYGPKHADVKKAFEFILKYRQPDGGVYNPQEGSSSYVGAVVLMALSAANLPEHAQARQDLVKYLKGLQIVPGSESADGAKVGEGDPQVGGVGYGPRGGRGDLSVTGMWMQALQEAGVEPNDPAMQRAAAFVTRLQNRSEANDAAEWTKKAPDGGFVYVIPGGGGRGGPQEPRSYGSMTYTGFKSLLYAGVDRKDPRVQAAFSWIRKYWQIDGNPNMPAGQSQAGLFYYYHVFAKALAAWGEPTILDGKGVRHNWRHELIDQLASIAKADGSWANPADRWQESSPVLTTVFALLAIEEAVSDPAVHTAAPAATTTAPAPR